MEFGEKLDDEEKQIKKMESMESSTMPHSYIFSTPLSQQPKAKNNLGLTTSSIDSGFGESLNSTLSQRNQSIFSSSSLSATNSTFFSPEDEIQKGRLVESEYDLSPLREFSGLQGRKLTFETSEIEQYFPSSETDLTFSYNELELLDGNKKDRKVEENVMDSTNSGTQESTKESFPFSIQHSSCMSSPLSSSASDLEFSLQEMSLEEPSSLGSLSSRSSPCCMKQSASQESLDIVLQSHDQSTQDHIDQNDSSSFFSHSPSSEHSLAGQSHKSDVTLTSNPISSHKIFYCQSLKRVIKHYSPSEPSRLIGRNTGVGKFDIIHHLSVNFPLIVQRIFQLLSPADLTSVCKVSLNWEKSLCNDSNAFQRYKKYLLENTRQTNHLREKDKENSSGEKPLEESLPEILTGTRGLLTTLQSQAKTWAESKTTGSSSFQPNYFLRCEDTLRRCPRCQQSAIIKPAEDRATCLNVKCGYDFCTHCFSAFHHPKRCKPLCRLASTAGVAGTRKSKKNLKRL